MTIIIRFLFVFVHLSFLQSLYSQTFLHFNRKVVLEERNTGTMATIPHAEGYYTVGVYVPNGYPIIYFADVYKEGTVLDYHILDDSTNNTTIVSGRQFIQTEDGNFALTYQKRYEPIGENTDVMLIKFTSTGQTLWSKRFGFDSVDNPNEVVQTSDEGYLIIGGAWINNQKQMYAIKTDSRGVLEWEKTYTFEGCTWCDAYSAIEVEDGFILGGLGSSEVKDRGMYVVKIDKLGNQKWAKHYGVSADDFACQVYLLEDGNLLLKGGFWKNGIREIYNAKLDSSGIIIWEKLYYLPDLWTIQTPLVFREDGGFIGVAAYDKGIINTPLIMNFDANGDTLWTKSITPDSTANVHVRDIDKIDGGYVLTGFKFSPLPQYGWMMTIDEEGNFCEELGCVETIVDIDEVVVGDEPSLTIFPNPAKNQLTLQWIEMPIGEDLELTIYNGIGREVRNLDLVVNKQKMTIPIDNLEGGVYYVQVKSAKTIYHFDKLVVIK